MQAGQSFRMRRWARASVLWGLLILLAPAGDAVPRTPRDLGSFVLTLYYVAEQRTLVRPGMAGSLPLYGAACRETIATVPHGFLHRLSREGTGRLRDGRVVNVHTACPCAPAGFGGVRYCYEVLDAAVYPWGRGARLGRRTVALRPFRSLAVDPARVPLGSAVLVPELRGRALPWGGVHDGCLRAEDTGRLIRGNKVDLFAGRPVWADWALRTHRLRSVRVVLHDPACQAVLRREALTG